MKKFVAYIFIIVFLFSTLPVKELGKLLSKAQTTEEVHGDDDGDCSDDDFGCKIKKDFDPFLEVNFHSEVSLVNSIANKILVAIHGASVIPDHFTPNIPTPPPDFC